MYQPLLTFIVVPLLAVFSVNADGQPVRVDGSSTVQPIAQIAADQFQPLMHGSIKVSVSMSETGAGFQKFCRGDTDINGASRPILKAEMEACRKAGTRYIELPIAYDAVTVVVHPRNDWANFFTLAELKTIWEPSAQAKITLWQQVRPQWPKRPLRLFGPGPTSGAFNYFTQAIVGILGASRSDFISTEDRAVVVQNFASEENALGYFGYADYAKNKRYLKAVAIDGGKGPVEATIENVRSASYQPLSRPLFIYASEKCLERVEANRFLAFYLLKASQFVRQAGYLPLPQRGYDSGINRIKNRKFGTLFDGQPAVGIKIDDLLKASPKL